MSMVGMIDAPYVLVHFRDNWADEMDLCGSRVFTQEAWADFLEKLNRVHWNHEFYVGTNESVEYRNKEDYLRHLTPVPCSSEDYEVLNRLKLLSCGFFVNPLDSSEIEDDDWDDE